MEPTLGRIVHYFPEKHSVFVDDGIPLEPRAAIITRVLGGDEQVVFLTVYEPVEPDQKVVARFGDGEPGTWIWPPRV